MRQTKQLQVTGTPVQNGYTATDTQLLLADQTGRHANQCSSAHKSERERQKGDLSHKRAKHPLAMNRYHVAMLKSLEPIQYFGRRSKSRFSQQNPNKSFWWR